jgi:hypothetical protein
VAIATENGADDGFDEIIDAFLKEAPLPNRRAYANYTEPQPLSDELKQQLRQSIMDEYGKDNIYVYAYGVGYTKRFATFEQYMDYIVDLVMTAAQNGANDALEGLYRAFRTGGPLPPVRRHPRRLKMW